MRSAFDGLIERLERVASASAQLNLVSMAFYGSNEGFTWAYCFVGSQNRVPQAKPASHPLRPRTQLLRAADGALVELACHGRAPWVRSTW